MAAFDEIAVIVIVVVVIIAIVACGIYFKLRNRDRNGPPTYVISDNYSQLDVEVKFKGKNNKQWIGSNAANKIVQEQQTEILKKKYETYAVNQRKARNYCRGSKHERTIRDDLPCINYRTDLKFFYPVLDEKIAKMLNNNDAIMLQHINMNKLTIYKNIDLSSNGNIVFKRKLGECCIMDSNNDEIFRSFRLIMETLEHPYIAKVYDIGLSKDKQQLYIFKEFNKKGSLRDHIYGCDLGTPYSEKYNKPGKPYNTQYIRKFGRQILEGLLYLSKCGLTHYHLHTGNILLKDGNIKLTEIENNFLGLQIKYPMHKHILQIKKLYPHLNVEIMLFGYVIFEMSTGKECWKSSPLDCFPELPNKLPERIKNILGRCFGDVTHGPCNNIQDIIDDPFFAAKNVPLMDIAPFNSLKNENIIVEQIRSITIQQCYYTYSEEALGIKKQIPKKKKKKKKKRKESYGNGIPTTTSNPAYPEANEISNEVKSPEILNDNNDESLSLFAPPTTTKAQNPFDDDE